MSDDAVPPLRPDTSPVKQIRSEARATAAASDAAVAANRVPGAFYMTAAALEQKMDDMEVPRNIIDQVLGVDGGWQELAAADFPDSALFDAMAALCGDVFVTVVKMRIETEQSGNSNALWELHEFPADTSVFTCPLSTAVAKYPGLEDRVLELNHVSGVVRIIFANCTFLSAFEARDVVVASDVTAEDPPKTESARRRIDTSHVATWDNMWKKDVADPIVIVLHGASGTGKTLCAVLAASSEKDERADRLDRVCLFIQPREQDDAGTTTTAMSSDALAQLPLPDFITAFSEQHAKSNEDRDTLFVAAFQRHLTRLVGQRPSTAGTGGGTVIVVFDEMAHHPLAVRAIISSRLELGKAARKAFGAATVCIAVVGTGVTGAVLQPGSYPSKYHVVQPNLRAAWVINRPTKWAHHIDDPKSTAAERCRDAVWGNSRFAALFINAVNRTRCEVRELLGQPHVIEACMAVAAHEYKAKNGLERLTSAELHVAIVDAVAATRLPALGHKDYRWLSGRLGLLEDWARFDTESEALVLEAEQPDVRAILPQQQKPTYGQRFSVSAATWIIVRACLNDVERPPTGDEGLGLSIADWLRWTALAEARSVGLREAAKSGPQPKWAGGKPPELGREKDELLQPRPRDGWIRPWQYHAHADPAPTPLKVHTLKLTKKIEPGCKMETVRELNQKFKGLLAKDAASHRVIAVNADQSAYADILEVDYHKKRLTLWQSKRLSAAFTAGELELELGKMGYGPCVQALHLAELQKRVNSRRAASATPEQVNAARQAAVHELLKDYSVDTTLNAKQHRDAINEALAAPNHWVALRAVLVANDIVLTRPDGPHSESHTARDSAAFARTLANTLFGTDEDSHVRFAVLVHSPDQPAAVPAFVSTAVRAGEVVCIHSLPRREAGASAGVADEWGVFEELYPVRVPKPMSIDSEHCVPAPPRPTPT